MIKTLSISFTVTNARLALNGALALTTLAGCRGTQPPIAPSSIVQGGDIRYPRGLGSWMLPQLESHDLAYIATDDVVYVYSYPRGTLVGTLSYYQDEGGLCVDAEQDVWVPDYFSHSLTEFAHGNPYAIGSIDDSGYRPRDCAIDPTSGNLAAINARTFSSSGYGNVAVYQNAGGSPTYYSDPNIAYYTSGAYDQSGNLYVDGFASGSAGEFRLAVLPKGSSTFTDIALAVPIKKHTSPGLFWDGKYLALSNGSTKIYRLSISGSVARLIKTVRVEQTFGLSGGFWIEHNRVIGNGQANANVWAYPKGGAPLAELPVDENFYGAAVSTAKSTTRYRTVYRFLGGESGPDGEHPAGGVVAERGLIYGTTVGGGSNDWGTVFDVTPSGEERVLYSFHGNGDASTPFAGLTSLNGVLYGTATQGGANDGGAVFAISPTGVEHVVYSFTGGVDGSAPYGGLVAISGRLYGCAETGGTGYGTIFTLTPGGKEKTLYEFKGGTTDGKYPQGVLTYFHGALYGTTYAGGYSNDGTVFKMSLGGEEQYVYSFGGGDGANPESGLVELNGLLYGTTFQGGNGDGTAYSVTESGKESVVYAFKDKLDGAFPIGSLARFGGNLYGTTSRGGFHPLFGTLFKLTTDGQLSVLHSFRDLPDGSNPESPLTLISGRLYGTASQGGSETGCPGYGCGTVYRVTP